MLYKIFTIVFERGILLSVLFHFLIQLSYVFPVTVIGFLNSVTLAWKSILCAV